MKCVLFGLLILGVCSSQIRSANHEKKGAQRFVRSSNHENASHPEQYSSVITAHLPSFLDSIDVEDVSDKNQNQQIQFKNVKVSGLSTAHSVTSRVNLVSKKVDCLLGFSKLQIKGTYSTPSSGDQNFVYNLYGHVTLVQNNSYAAENGKVNLKKGEPHLRFRKAKIDYTGAANLKFLSQNLLHAVANKIDAEVRPKLSDSLNGLILKEEAFKIRRDAADRIRKAILECFDIVELTRSNQEIFGVFYLDHTNFTKTIENIEVKIPSFTLRGVEKFSLVSIQPSFSKKGVYMKAVYEIPNPVVMLDIKYKKANDEKAEYEEDYGEYHPSKMVYTFEVSEKLGGTVELDKTTVHIDSVKVAPTQGLFGTELDKVIQQLPAHLISYIADNASGAVTLYVNGFFRDHLNREKRTGQ